MNTKFLLKYLGCTTSGAHFNPQSKDHGDISATIRHVGDYGNILADDKGHIQQVLYDGISSLNGPNSIIGRTLVLHALPDDLGLNPDPGSKTTGNSGARIACGVIGYDSS
jgi:Cu-Zn family superoxide dismutase